MALINIETYFACPLSNSASFEGIETKGIEQFFPSVSFPRNGMTFLTSNISNNVAHQYILNSAPDDVVHVPLRLKAELNSTVTTQRVDLSDKPNKGLSFAVHLSTLRMCADVMDLVNTIYDYPVDGKLYSGRFPREPLSPTSGARVIEAFMKIPELKHIKVLTYQLITQEVGEIQVSTVFDLSCITDFVDILTELPSNVDREVKIFRPSLTD